MHLAIYYWAVIQTKIFLLIFCRYQLRSHFTLSKLGKIKKEKIGKKGEGNSRRKPIKNRAFLSKGLYNSSIIYVKERPPQTLPTSSQIRRRQAKGDLRFWILHWTFLWSREYSLKDGQVCFPILFTTLVGFIASQVSDILHDRHMWFDVSLYHMSCMSFCSPHFEAILTNELEKLEYDTSIRCWYPLSLEKIILVMRFLV